MLAYEQKKKERECKIAKASLRFSIEASLALASPRSLTSHFTQRQSVESNKLLKAKLA